MIKKILYAVIVTLCFLAALWLWWSKPEEKIHLRQVSYADLPGWQEADPRPSLMAFKKSCQAFLRQNPEKAVGSQVIEMQAKDWQPLCRAVQNVKEASIKDSKEFFEQWFVPATFYDNQQVRGLFTGYYMPLYKGSLHKTEQFQIPLYGLPKDLITVDLSRFDPDLKFHKRIVGRLKGHQLVPYYTHAEITAGKIHKKAPVVAWIENHVDRQFLEIQGSGIIELPSGRKLYIGYAGQNGAPYRSIAGVLINMGVMTKDNASMQRIRRYLQENPEKIKEVLHQNESFIFFDKLPRQEALGTQGVGLTAGYSMAVDRKWVPMGMPLWLDTTRPTVHSAAEKIPFKRLMVAQDTGGAIKGPVRGDVFWGAGDRAEQIAGRMKNKGFYWLLLPRTIASSILTTTS